MCFWWQWKQRYCMSHTTASFVFVFPAMWTCSRLDTVLVDEDLVDLGSSGGFKLLSGLPCCQTLPQITTTTLTPSLPPPSRALESHQEQYWRSKSCTHAQYLLTEKLRNTYWSGTLAPTSLPLVSRKKRTMSGRVTQHCAAVIQQGKGKAAKNFKKTWETKEKMMMMRMMKRMMRRMGRRSFDVLCHFSSTKPQALSTGHWWQPPAIAFYLSH